MAIHQVFSQMELDSPAVKDQSIMHTMCDHYIIATYINNIRQIRNITLFCCDHLINDMLWIIRVSPIVEEKEMMTFTLQHY